ncbi:MAG: TIGR02221 family CRISPR-associated protein [Peptococcales bacterium]
MAKILITPLGVGPTERNVQKREYSKAKYVFEGTGNEYETKFVAAALVNYLSVDKIFFIGTSKSMWEEVYNYFTTECMQEPDNDYWLILSEKVSNFNVTKFDKLDENELTKVNQAVDNYLKFKNKNASGGSASIIIDYGVNESELWGNLDRLMCIEKMLEDGDEIYLDITHSFRSIPIFLYLLMDFIMTLSHKKIKFGGLFYGMLEINKEKGYVPVVDLGPLFQLSRWIKGTFDFTNYGNGYLIADLVEQGSMSNPARNIKNISDLVNINYLPDLKNQLEMLQKNLKKVEGTPHSVFKYVAPNLLEFVNRFAKIETNHGFLLEIAEWYFENKRYSHGYICLLEAILTALTDVYHLESNHQNKEMMKNNLLFSKEYKYKLQVVKELNNIFNTVNKIRKRIAHGCLEDPTAPFRNDIETYLKNLNAIKKVLSSKELTDLVNKIPLEEIINTDTK